MHIRVEWTLQTITEETKRRKNPWQSNRFSTNGILYFIFDQLDDWTKQFRKEQLFRKKSLKRYLKLLNLAIWPICDIRCDKIKTAFVANNFIDRFLFRLMFSQLKANHFFLKMNFPSKNNRFSWKCFQAIKYEKKKEGSDDRVCCLNAFPKIT